MTRNSRNHTRAKYALGLLVLTFAFFIGFHGHLITWDAYHPKSLGLYHLIRDGLLLFEVVPLLPILLGASFLMVYLDDELEDQ